MLKSFRRGATFIQGGTSIPESRAYEKLDKFKYLIVAQNYFFFELLIYLCLRQLIVLDVLNSEHRIFVVVFCRQAQWKNLNKYSKFDTSKLISPSVSNFYIKVQLFWEGHKILKKYPTCFDANE